MTRPTTRSSTIYGFPTVTMEHAKQEPPPTEPILPCDTSETALADSFRTQSFHLMEAHPIAAAHLFLAAASIAPTCDAEQDVANQFS